MLSRFTGVAAPFRVVTVAPSVAGLRHFAQAAALAEAEGLPDAFLALDSIGIRGNHLVCSNVALKGVTVLSCTACHGWAELSCAFAVALEVHRAVDVLGVGWGACPLFCLPFSSTYSSTNQHRRQRMGPKCN